VTVVLSFFFFICCVCYFFYLKLTGYDLIFKFFFCLSTSKYIFGVKYFLFFNMDSFYSNRDQKKSKKAKKKSLKKPNFEKAVSGRLPISLTANRPVNH
jgi:hypothetical protein